MSRDSILKTPASKGYEQPLNPEDYAYTPCSGNYILADDTVEGSDYVKRAPFDEFGGKGSGAGRK
jgi:hypothetical protein